MSDDRTVGKPETLEDTSEWLTKSDMVNANLNIWDSTRHFTSNSKPSASWSWWEHMSNPNVGAGPLVCHSIFIPSTFYGESITTCADIAVLNTNICARICHAHFGHQNPTNLLFVYTNMRAWQSCHLSKLCMMIGVAENREWATAKKEFCFLQIVPTENFDYQINTIKDIISPTCKNLWPLNVFLTPKIHTSNNTICVWGVPWSPYSQISNGEIAGDTSNHQVAFIRKHKHSYLMGGLLQKQQSDYI